MKILHQGKLDFHGQELVTAWDTQEVQWVAISPICKGVGLSVQAQQRRLTHDPRYRVSHIAVPSTGGAQTMLCIPVHQLNGWLFNVNANKVSTLVRDSLLLYQAECFNVLYAYYMPNGGADKEIVDIINTLRGDIHSVRDDLHEEIADGLSSIREEVDELRTSLRVTLSDNDEREIRVLLRRVKDEKGMDGRTIIGHVRKTLGTSGVYNTPNLQQVKNVLRNLLGLGVFGQIQPEVVQAK